jgi:hypothetical protein
MTRSVVSVFAAAALGLAFGISLSPATAQEAQPKVQTIRDFPDLVSGLKATPGCLGVETAIAKGGKQALVMAWFKDKKAVLDWYYSPMHQDAMKRFFPGMGDGRKPLSLIEDPNTPLLVIASVTPSDKPLKGQTLAVSQISIEMYAAAPGGLSIGGSLAPESFPVKGLVRIPGDQ